MIPGWMSSSWTERLRRNTYAQIAAAKDEVAASGRRATAEHEAGSFYTKPNDVPSLATFDEGIAAAVRTHFEQQGLDELAASVDGLERLGRRVMKRYETSDTVSDFVYEMY